MYYIENIICSVRKVSIHCPLVLLKSVWRHSRILNKAILCTCHGTYFEQLQYLGRVLMFAFRGMNFGNTRVTLNRLYQGGNLILNVRELYEKNSL